MLEIFRKYNHTVPPLSERIRCSDYLIGIFPGLESKSAVKKALKKERVTIGGETAKSGTWITGNENICFVFNNAKVVIWEKKIIVHWQDNYLAVVEKPAGIPTSGNQLKNLRNTLPYNLNASSDEDALLQPEPIHRLDAATSGLVLVAKTWNARRLLGDKLKYSGIIKEYFALVSGDIKDIHKINTPIDGKSAITLINKISLHHSNLFGLYSLVSVRPFTGRTHQIRIHFASIDCPVLGDKIHNRFETRLVRGLILHAHFLGFYHPVTKVKIEVKSPLPKRFLKKLLF